MDARWFFEAVVEAVYDLQAVLLLELEVLLPEGVDAVNHDLDQLHLGVAETVLVGDVVGVACRKGGFN